MQHWYAHHSEKKMGRPYPRMAEPQFYTTKRPASLQPGDWLWVIEGNMSTPTRFSLVDCFEITAIAEGSFPATASRFKFELKGGKSKLSFSYGLNRADDWFAKLHDIYLRRGISFNRLDNYPEIIAGLKTSSGVAG